MQNTLDKFLAPLDSEIARNLAFSQFISCLSMQLNRFSFTLLGIGQSRVADLDLQRAIKQLHTHAHKEPPQWSLNTNPSRRECLDRRREVIELVFQSFFLGSSLPSLHVHQYMDRPDFTILVAQAIARREIIRKDPIQT